MIRLELRRLDPIRTANLAALVYAVLMAAVALLVSPIFFLASMMGATDGPEALFPMGMSFVLLIFYPLMGLIMGWIGGVLGALVFNLVSKWIGGLILDVEQLESAGPGSPVGVAAIGTFGSRPDSGLE